nr:MAG TPA_asm: hypothetical protein [Caudoviricetes sp.]
MYICVSLLSFDVSHYTPAPVIRQRFNHIQNCQKSGLTLYTLPLVCAV